LNVEISFNSSCKETLPLRETTVVVPLMRNLLHEVPYSKVQMSYKKVARNCQNFTNFPTRTYCCQSYRQRPQYYPSMFLCPALLNSHKHTNIYHWMRIRETRFI
jgi:hypothetical protein